MKIFDKYDVDETNLAATNLTESTSEWDVATTYDAGDEVHVVSTKTVYVSAIDSNTGNDPTTSDADTWIIKGAMNKWAAFDAFLANLATNAGTITYSIDATEIVNGIAFFALKADEIEITVSDGAGQSETVTADLLSLDHINGSWYNWFTGGRPRSKEYIFLQLPYYGPSTEIAITITANSGDAQVGQIALGKVFELGKTLAGVNLRSQNFTRYIEDEFGNLTTIPRASIRKPEIDVFVNSGNVRRGERFLRDIQGRATVFIGSEDVELALLEFGVLTQFDHYIDNRNFHHIKMELRGLI